MSAICGIVNFDGAPVETGALEKMARAAAAGTPVTVALSSDGGAGFSGSGSTCGLAGGGGLRPDRPCALLAVDARLDNRQALLRSLALPAEPGDERLMAAAYERWGEQWHRHLCGAYAAAAYDRQAGKLLLLRDRSGERGLYWCNTSGGFLFASEPAMLIASGRIGGEPNRLRILAYILGAPAEPTWSYFEGVHRVPEGHQVHLTVDRITTEHYGDWTSVTPEPWDGAAAAPELARRLQEAVDRRLAPRGETGVLLSGGLESSSVAALAAGTLARRGRRLHAFTWTSKSGDGMDETPLSRVLIGSRADIVEHSIEADALWPLSRYPEAYADRSDPETNAFPDLLLATLEAARQQGVTVLMNGIGGDPVAGGLAPELALLLRGRFGALWRRWHLAGLRHAGLLRELRFIARRPRWPDWLTPQARRQAMEAGLDRHFVSGRALSSPDRFRRAALASPANAAALERFDRLSRRFGVRIEAPWHDADLATLVLAFPDRALATAPPAKRLVRAAMAGRLPEPILHAPKAGRRSGLEARGLLGGGRDLVEQILSGSLLEELGLVIGSRLLAAYREKAARQEIAPKLWEVLTAETWLRASAKLGRITGDL